VLESKLLLNYTVEQLWGQLALELSGGRAIASHDTMKIQGMHDGRR
jgi:hypothetical protein